ncbi:MAG: matrixin family metalloprotease [Phycisphaerales bacterium]|jgi:hypothetical protein
MRFVHPALAGVVSLMCLVGAAGAGETPTPVAASPAAAEAALPVASPTDSPAEALLFQVVERQLFASLPEQQQRMLLSFARSSQYSCTPVAVCFTPDTPEETVRAFLATASGYGPRFNTGNRWGPTALDPTSTGTPGIRTTLTYSFVPDGTNVPDGVGEGAGVSNLYAFLNGIYGTPAAWQAVYAQVFSRWSELTGITYVYEPNDDGADLVDAPGVAGVRGDLRLSGKFIDGNSGILAYNYFPQSGDMVIDTGDNFYNNTAGNSLALRNVLAHEHGHGMALFHECPVDQTKLMEPFISTNYDGPRHDDVRGAQSLYGDSLEPNEAAPQATDVGALTSGTATIVGVPGAPALAFGSRISISTTNDQDWFRFSVNSARVLTATVRPVGLAYVDTFQSGNCTNTGSCCPGSVTDSTLQASLGLEIRDGAGNTVLASDAGATAGVDRVVNDLCLAPGTYYARVFAVGGVNEAQLYSLTLQADVAPIRARAITPPTLLAPGVATGFDVAITSCGESLVPGSAALRYRTGTSGPFVSLPLVALGGGRYRATLPSLGCISTVQYYVEARGAAGTLTVSPVGAPASVYTALVGQSSAVFSDNFETDQGWTVTNDAGLTDGAWERGVPVGEGGRYDPAADFDGSGQCYLTGNRIGNSDVDGSTTRLLSPTISLVGATAATVSYARWFRDSVFDGDRFTAEVSNNNGGGWTLLESVADVQGWNVVSLPITVPLTSTMKFRFSASDVNPQSVVEAGLDAFTVRVVTCAPPPPQCDPDVNQDGNSDQGDVDYLINVVAGGSNSTNIDPDFNQDGNVDQGDVDALLNVVAGGACP